MTSSTVSVSLRTSSFQNRITRNPRSCKQAVRWASAACRSTWAAVEFDDQLPFEADEVHDIGRERILAAKFMACKVAVAQVLPEATFSVGLVPAEFLGDFGGH